MFEADNKLVLKTHDDWQWEDTVHKYYTYKHYRTV